MKKGLFLFFFLFIPLFSQDRIVAIVGNKVIFENDVLRKSKIEKIDYSTSLNSLIEEKLLLCQAEKENIEVKDEEIKNEIERMKRSFKTLNDFYNYLKISGLSLSQIESEIENNLKIKKLVREKIIKKIEITPVEIANEMEKIEGKYCEYEFYFKWFDDLTSCEEFIKNFSAKSLDEMEYAKLKSLEIIEALVTLPISKKAWFMAGYNYAGHTELLSEKLNEKKYAMVMIAERYKVLLLTTHIPLRKVSEILNEELVIEKVEIGYEFLKKLKIKNPTIGICGLNPHAGENGVLGNEEIEIIKPAVEKLKRKGINIEGPLPADTIYRRNFDLIIAIYHDQCLIPLKTFYFEKLINFTAGIKLIRTSPGHGTAYDIAYKNKGNPESFIEAYKFAANLI